MLSKGPYNPRETEPRILKYWLENKFFKPEYHPDRGLITTDEMKRDKRESFCIINPPPNAYMRPHIGNVSGYAYQDVFLRFNRMKGKKVLGQPGKDHAGIQGEVVLEKIFMENHANLQRRAGGQASKRQTKQEMGREKFYKAAYAHFEKLMPKVMADEQRIGLSSDYDRNLFTLDPKVVKTVLDTFVKMFKDKMVYKGVRIVNWDPVAKTTLADIDTERVERDTELVYIKYPFAEKGDLGNLKVIIFDLNKVLFNTGGDKKYQAIAKELGYPDWKKLRDLMTEVTDSGNNIRLGKMTLEEFWAEISKKIDIKIIDPIKIHQLWLSFYFIYPEVLDFIIELRKRGYKIGLISNTDQYRHKYLEERYNFLQYFDYQVFSFEHALLKPDPKIYELFEKISGAKGNEILFIDDKTENLTVAKKKQWETFLYTGEINDVEQYLRTGKKYITVATTRAETMLGDTAVVVNPADEKYKNLIGEKVILPLTNREIPIISSARVEKEFGTGAVKLTPAHSYDDYVMMNEWNASQEDRNKKVGYINIINKGAKMDGPIPAKYKGMTTLECRKAVEADLEKLGLILKREPHTHSVMVGERSKAVIEQIMSSQWFIDVEKLKQPAIEAVRNNSIRIHPEYMKKKYLNWMENLQDWPVSRTLWWGYRIPVWYKGKVKEIIDEQTGQIKETINQKQIAGIQDAVGQGLVKVQQVNPDSEKNFAPVLIPGRFAPEIGSLYSDYKQIYPYAQIADTGRIDQTYHDYKLAFDQLHFDEKSVIIAHSLGAPAILQYLLENHIKIKTLLLLSPSNLASPQTDYYKSRGFWQNYENLPDIHTLVGKLIVIYSDNDPHYSKEDLEDFADYIKADRILESGKQHFLTTEYRDDSKVLEKLIEAEALEAGATIIHAIRHGETEDNKNGIFCGQRDTSLNEEGKKQADDFAQAVAGESYNLIISSPLARARETAEIIGHKLNLDIKYSDEIKERNFGQLEGKRWEDIKRDLPEIAMKISENYQPDLPEGEHVEDVITRVNEFLQKLDRYKGKKILIVTHTGVLRILRRELLSESAESTRKKDPENLQKFVMTAGYSQEWTQDKDVFDTWFSSGQWPFATLAANDLMEIFYPTDIMETAYDILELWVSRMIMLGIYTQRQVPFRDVYLHGLVKAPDGQKMSKSKGNVIQPEEIINQYGADALRLMYIVGNKAGAGYPVSYEKLEGYKRFLNKIWNASRFVLNNIQDLDTDKSQDIISRLSNKQDKDILENLKKLTDNITRHIEKYRIGLAAELLYQDFWHSFCDEYLEDIKPRLYVRDKEGKAINTTGESRESREEAQATLLYTLKEYLKLMHPFVPFITEAIWQEVPGTNQESVSISHAKWGYKLNQ